MASSASADAYFKKETYERSFFRWAMLTHPAPFEKHGITEETLERPNTARAAFYNSDWPGARMLVKPQELSTSDGSITTTHRYCRTALFDGIIERGLRESTRFSVEHITSDEKAKLGIDWDDTSEKFYLREYGAPSQSTSLKGVSEHGPPPETEAQRGRAISFEIMGERSASCELMKMPADDRNAHNAVPFTVARDQENIGIHTFLGDFNSERSLFRWAMLTHPVPFEKHGITEQTLERADTMRAAFYNSNWPGARMIIEREEEEKRLPWFLGYKVENKVRYHQTSFFARIKERCLREGVPVDMEHITSDEKAKLGIALDDTSGEHYLSCFGPTSPSASRKGVSDHQPSPKMDAKGARGEARVDTSPWKTARSKVPSTDKPTPLFHEVEGGKGTKTLCLPEELENTFEDATSLESEGTATIEDFLKMSIGDCHFGGKGVSQISTSAMDTARDTEEPMENQKCTGRGTDEEAFAAARARADSRRALLQWGMDPQTRLGESQPSFFDSLHLGGRASDQVGSKIADEYALQEAILTRSLESGPAVYVSKVHEVELELQEGSLEEAIPLPVTIAPSIKCVVCRTGEGGRAPFHGDAPSEEFLAMTFVHGPPEATFRSDRPAKLRYFMGFADEFASSETPDEVVPDESIESHIVESYRPLTSPDGERSWAVLGLYSVVFRLVGGRREVWAETPLEHFCEVAHGRKVSIKGYDDLKHGDTSYYYGNIGGFLTRRLKGTSPTPKVRFGNATKEFATFTSYPIVEHTDVASEHGMHAEFGAASGSVGGGRQTQSSVSGFALSAVREPQTTVVRPGSYHDGELVCDIKAHLQMRVKVGILQDMKAGANGMMNAKGTLQLLDSLPISGYKMLVLRQPRLETPSQYKPVDWPCTGDDIRGM